ncbi:MAG TPA: MmgE/PrpD family protein [Burkholderiaceae bacterium]|nr:MmgE/PrpD family protein [Burkholderiaceae bacterium]
MNKSSLTYALATFIDELKDPVRIPPEVLEKAKVSLLNGYGIGVACFDTPYWETAARAALSMYGECENGATMLANGKKTSISGAVLANGALFHGRAQEDASGAAHLGAILIPLLTALLETKRMPASRLLPALIAGYEVGGLFESNYAGKTTPAGLRASPLYGAPAAAAATALALDLDVDQTAAALANSMSFAGGILQSFGDGTDEWRYQLGMAAHNGWVAAELARAGSVSAPFAAEGKHGFVQAYTRTPCDVDALKVQIGKTWFIHRVIFKPYPVCAFNQTPVNTALKLREVLQGRIPEDITVRMNPYETGYAGMDSHGPFFSVSGTLMSIPFCIATTLIRGAPTIADMMRFDDPEVMALTQRITLVSDESVPTLGCRIDMRMDSGETISEALEPTTEYYNFKRPEVLALIRRVCAEVGAPEDAGERLEQFVDAPCEAGLQTVLDVFAELRNQEVAHGSV